MKNKIIAVLVCVILAAGLPAGSLFAEGEITLTLAQSYPEDTFPGTALKVIPQAVLEAGYKIEYLLNGESVGMADNTNEFAFSSVAGKNELSARILNTSDEVIAESAPIEQNFIPYISMKKFAEIDFEDGVIDPDDYYLYESSTIGGYGISVAADEGTGNLCMKNSIKAEEIMYNGASVTVNKGSSIWQINFPSSTMAGTCTGGWAELEFDIKFDNFSATSRLFFVKTSGGGEYVGPVIDSGTGKLLMSGGAASGKVLEVGRWYKMKSVINLDDRTADFYMDGERIQTDYALKPEFKDLLYYNLPRFMSLKEDTYSTCYLDNIRLESFAAAYGVTASATAQDGSARPLDEFPLTGGKLELTFSEEMEEITKDDFSFTSDGHDVSFEFSYDLASKTVSIVPSEPFAGREKCRISFENIRTALGAGSLDDSYVDFSAASPDYGIQSVSHGDFAAGTSIDVTVNVKNKTNSAQDGIILIGIYKNKRLISVATKSVTDLASSAELPYVLEGFRIPEDYSAQDCGFEVYLMEDSSFKCIDMLR